MQDNDPIKILCVHQGYELYGSDRVFIQSVKAFRELWPNSEITVHLPERGILLNHLEEYADHILIGNISILRRNKFGLASIFSLFKNISYNYKLSRNNDLVYINTGVVLSYIFLSFFKRKKYILHIHEIPTGLIKLYFYMITILTKAMIIVNSNATGKSLGTNLAKVIYNGIKNSTIAKSQHHEKPLKLLLIGRINSWKGHELALEAINLLKLKDIHLKFVGSYFDGQHQYLKNLQNKVALSGMNSKVTFSAFITDPSEYYRWADIVLVPSTKPEPFGLVAIEAMNYSLPVIAANHGGLPEIVDHDQTGLLFKPNDIQSLADAIDKYYQHPELLSLHGNAGKKRFMQLFQEENYIRNFKSIVKAYVE